jgi:hypothetical protein
MDLVDSDGDADADEEATRASGPIGETRDDSFAAMANRFRADLDADEDDAGEYESGTQFDESTGRMRPVSLFFA